MKKAITFILSLIVLLIFFSNCKKDDRNVAGDVAEITAFNIQGLGLTFEIDSLTSAITHDGLVPAGTDVSNLIADFEYSPGALVTVAGVEQISGVTPNDFTNKVSYYVLSANKSTAKEYKVTVNVEGAPLSSDAFLTEFDIPSLGVDFTIDHTFGTITHPDTLPLGTDVTALIAVFSFSDDASVTVGGVDQESGVTANDFTDPVVYTVTSEDQTSSISYTVTVNVEPPPTSIWERMTSDAGFLNFQDQRAAMLGGEMYIMGTMSENIGGPNHYEVWRSPDGINWLQVNTTPTAPPYAFFELLAHNNTLHLIGGATLPDVSTGNFEAVAQNSVSTSTNGSSWMEFIGLPLPARVFYRGAVFNSEMYVIGGNPLSSSTPQTPFTQVWKSDNATNWNMVTNAGGFGPRSTPAVFVHNGKLWMTGGGGVKLPGPEPVFNDVWHSNNGSDWTKVNVSQPYPKRTGHVGLSYNGNMYILFGSDNALDLADRTFYGDIWMSSDEGVTWTEVTGSTALPPEFTARGGTSVLVDAQNMVWVIGGLSNGGTLRDIWRGEL